MVHIIPFSVARGRSGNPAQITPLRRHATRFRKGELWRLIQKCEAEGSASNRETATRIVQAKGWDVALVKPLMDCIKTAKGRRRRKAFPALNTAGTPELA